MADRTVRPIAEDEFAAALGVVWTAFLRGPGTDEETAVARSHIDTSRMVAAFDDDGRMCGASRVFASQLTVAGGEVTAGAVSSVGVLPTHRRQGHLTGMMRALLDDSAGRGEPVATLIAAEYPIYGRYGFGPATEACGLRLDATARWRSEPTGSVELVDGEVFAKVAEQLYDRVRRATPGHIDQPTVYWRVRAGLDAQHDGHDDERRNAHKVVWRDAEGEVQAAAAYAVTGDSVNNRPAATLRTDLLVAATGEAEHELLRFFASVDLIARVEVGLRPIDDPAPLALVDGRLAVLADRSDHVWLRVLDVPAALAARRYAAPVDLVIEVDDPGGYASGRFRLEAGPDGATCAPSDAAPDLAVPAPALGSAYLGGIGWARLAAAGWVAERTPGAVARAAAAFTAPPRPVVRGDVLTGGRPMGTASVRRPSEDDFAVAVGVVRTAFLETPPTDAEIAGRRKLVDLARMRVAVDGDGRICGSARAFPTPLTTPGGEVAAGGVTSVGVLPTHRRRGHLTRMMRGLLDDSVERGEPVSVLVAAEYPIYGRYGYGPATESCTLRLDASARWVGEPAGRVEIVDAETWVGLLGGLYDRQRRRNPGHIRWNPVRWRMSAGLEPSFDGDDANRHRRIKVIWHDDGGEIQGAAIYDSAGSWEDNRPSKTLKVEWLVAATEQAERELLRFLASVDWVAQIEVEVRPIDDPTALALVDGRHAVLAERWDHVWLRMLDVPDALTARRYAAPVDLVIEVDDAGGYASGRFRLDGGPDGAECARTDAEPDLAVTVPALGAAYLGGTGWARLAAAGWVDERTPGAVARAAAGFAAPRAPWSAMTF